jgi:hypothetical protein
MNENNPQPQTVDELIEASYGIPNGQSEKIELLERAVALADTQNDLVAGYEARDELLEAASFGGHPEKMLVAFAWMLAQIDKHGEDELEADEHDLLWKYKWVINSLTEFPSIPASRIEAAFGDFRARLERGGYSLRTVHYLRWKYAHHRGDWADADQERAVWARSADDEMGDCTACEANFLTAYLAAQQSDKAALEAARLILSGRQSCAEVPHATLGTVLGPMLRLGQYEEAHYQAAVAAHLRGYRMIRDNPSHLDSCGEHLAFLAYSHNLGPALTLLERHLGWALATANLEARFGFYSATMPLWARLRAAGETQIKFRAPQDFPLVNMDLHFNLDLLEDWFAEQLAELAARFDARNGNSHFASRVKADPGLLASVPALTLSDKPTRKRRKGQEA